MGKLDGRVALVTGGNGGLGGGIVKGLLAEGAKVVFCGRNEEKNQAALERYKEISDDVVAIRCDVGNSADVKAMFAQIMEQFGRLDILVNNAAVTGGRGLHHSNGKTDREKYLNLTTLPGEKFSLEITKNLTDEEWEDCIQVNLNGVFYCTREALKIMEAK
ncbi:MAG: SDR family NAD(P)-dependent oxidoreductase, partial [Peptococcaceae bacterium]